MNRTKTIRTLRSTSVWFSAATLAVLLLCSNAQSDLLTFSADSSASLLTPAAVSSSPVSSVSAIAGYSSIALGTIVVAALDSNHAIVGAHSEGCGLGGSRETTFG